MLILQDLLNLSSSSAEFHKFFNPRSRNLQLTLTVHWFIGCPALPALVASCSLFVFLL